jgi:ABC-type transport system substrate-binding protein
MKKNTIRTTNLLLTAILLFSTSLLLLSPIGLTSSETPGLAPPLEEAPDYGHKKYYTVIHTNALPPPTGILNPWNPAWAATAAGWRYTGAVEPLLASLTNNDTMIPFLAISQEMEIISETPFEMTVTLKLREGAKWHDGTEFTSRDVLCYWTMWWLSTKAYDVDQTSGELVKITAPDDYTVIFELRTPNPGWKASYGSQIMYSPYSVWGSYMDQTLEEAGITDWRVLDLWTRISPGDKTAELDALREEVVAIRLTPQQWIGTGWCYIAGSDQTKNWYNRNPDWWGVEQGLYEKPAWDGLVQITSVASADVSRALLLDGVVAYGSWGPEMEAIWRNSAELQERFIRAYHGTQFENHGVVLNYYQWPLNILEVRQAIAYGFNRTTYSLIMGYHDVVKDSDPLGIAPHQWVYVYSGYDDTYYNNLIRYNYDPGKSKQILESIGCVMATDGYYTLDGKTLELKIGHHGGWTLDAFTNLAQEMEIVGIKAVLTQYPWGEWWPGVKSCKDPQASIDLPWNVWNLWAMGYGNPAGGIHGLAVEKAFPALVFPNATVHGGLPQTFTLPEWVSPGGITANITESIQICQQTMDPELAKEHFRIVAYYWNKYILIIPAGNGGIPLFANNETIHGWDKNEFWNVEFAMPLSFDSAGVMHKMRLTPVESLAIVEVGGGTTTPSAGEYRLQYEYEEDVTITATAVEGYEFDHWEQSPLTLDEWTNIGTDNPVVITMDFDYKVRPVFTLIETPPPPPPYELYAAIAIAVIAAIAGWGYAMSKSK